MNKTTPWHEYWCYVGVGESEPCGTKGSGGLYWDTCVPTTAAPTPTLGGAQTGDQSQAAPTWFGLLSSFLFRMMSLMF